MEKRIRNRLLSLVKDVEKCQRELALFSTNTLNARTVNDEEIAAIVRAVDIAYAQIGQGINTIKTTLGV